MCAMNCIGSRRSKPCHNASLCVWRQPCADECLNLTHLQPCAAAVPAHQLGGKNECATAAEEAARVAWACGVLRMGLTPKFRGARLARPKCAVVEASPATPS